METLATTIAAVSEIVRQAGLIDCDYEKIDNLEKSIVEFLNQQQAQDEVSRLKLEVEQLKKQLEGAQQFPTRDILDKTLASMEGNE